MTETKASYDVEEETAEAMAMLGKGYDAEQVITDPSDLRKWRIELPNLYDDSNLDPYEFRLLVHYKRVGTCTQSTKTTSTKAHMSQGQVSEKRQSLHDKGFIVMETVYLDDEKKTYSYRITVVDMWEENFRKYSTRSRGEGKPSRSEGPPHSVKQRKNQVKKEPSLKNKRGATPPPPEVTLFHDLTGRYPAKPSFETVVESVQKVKTRLGRDVTADDLKPFLTAWTDKAWNPLNLAWLKEWAVTGIVPNGQQRPKSSLPQPPAGNFMAELAAKKARLQAEMRA